MPHFNSELFRHEVINIVGQIPRGRVLTYGQIARLAGYPLHSVSSGREQCRATCTELARTTAAS